MTESSTQSASTIEELSDRMKSLELLVAALLAGYEVIVLDDQAPMEGESIN